MRLVWIMLVATAAAAAVVVSPAGAAPPTTCTGTITGQTIDGNVIVPDGVLCVLVGTQVNGSVQVLHGGQLGLSFMITDPVCAPACGVGSHVLGNIVATGCGGVGINFSEVEGNVVASQCDNVVLDRGFVGGKATLIGNGGLFFHDAGVGGNLVATNNGSLLAGFSASEGQPRSQATVPSASPPGASAGTLSAPIMTA